MPIDTDDLSEETYNAIIVQAERFHHDLTPYFGELSESCRDEAMFIKKSEALAREMLAYDESEIDDLFFDDPPAQAEFQEALKKILDNISKLRK